MSVNKKPSVAPVSAKGIIKSIGVIGAGQMGLGIAQVCASAGFTVYLNDISEKQIEAGIIRISEQLTRQVSKEQITHGDLQRTVENIKPTHDCKSMETCQLVIEAATENEGVKRKLFSQICEFMHPQAVLATNTSSISVTGLAASTDRPTRFIGIHFMNPVPRMQLVELIRGIATDESTYGIARNFIKALGKDVVVSEDFPGFIVNRILLPMINEAVYTLHEGVATVASIDKAMRLGANHPMGPLELADFIGLDTCLSIMQVLHDGLADSKYRPCPLLVKYVKAGWLGRKTKRGFYDYRGDAPAPTR